MDSETEKQKALIDAGKMEIDLAQSAWYDRSFAEWFALFTDTRILFFGEYGSLYFKKCADIAITHRCAPADIDETGEEIFTDKVLLSFIKREFFAKFVKFPKGITHKPTSWQIKKAKNYLSSRNNELLVRSLSDAEDVRRNGDPERADMLADEARKLFTDFDDTSVSCNTVFSDMTGIVSLSDENPPLFTLDCALGEMLNQRLKPDNLGVFLADPKVGKTTMLVDMAILASKNVPTLLIGTGDESELKYNARIMTYLSFCATQREYAHDYYVPVPDCQHCAEGTCPLAKSGPPRVCQNWITLMKLGHPISDIVEGNVKEAQTTDGNVYVPCTECFPKYDGTPQDNENRKRWKSSVWWRKQSVPLGTREEFLKVRDQYNFDSRNGGLRIAAYGAETLSVDGIRSLLDTLDRRDNFVPRVIVIDYADLMKQVTLRASDKDHDGMMRIWMGLRNLSRELDALVLTATQTNREDDEAETKTRRNIGRSAKAADNATWLCSLNQLPYERAAKVMRVSMMVAREGEFDLEHQVMCCQWNCLQDSMAFTMPVFRKIVTGKGENK